ncbi:hypothetical protein [Rhodospirillaceae bacterium SYSU D60014]|uniref:hypothetical protein n=1 Tax=Virgifigura deserti TaxID=2268457 RepID=UPI000E65F42B
MRSPPRPSTIATAHQRTAARYWELAEIAEKTGHIARAREFVALALKFDQRAAAVAGRLSDDHSGLRRPLKAARTPLVEPTADIGKPL